MQQREHPTSAVDRAIPSRAAAIALLFLDAVLLVIPCFVHWQSWFAFAYIPLLFTVAWGVMLGGVRKRPVYIFFSLLLVLPLGIGLAMMFPGHDLERLDYVLIGGKAMLAGIGVIMIGLAIRGWVRFFSHRSA